MSPLRTYTTRHTRTAHRAAPSRLVVTVQVSNYRLPSGRFSPRTNGGSVNVSGALRPLAARSLRVPLPCYDPLRVPRLHLGVRDCPAAGQSRAPEGNLAEE